MSLEISGQDVHAPGLREIQLGKTVRDGVLSCRSCGSTHRRGSYVLATRRIRLARAFYNRVEREIRKRNDGSGD